MNGDAAREPVLFPRLSTRERDRRWGIAQQLIDAHDLAALLVYGEPEGSGVPHFAPDNYFTGDRTGSIVLVLPGQAPRVFAPVHLAIGDHLEASRQGEQPWLEPEQFITPADDLPAGAARGGAFVAEHLKRRGLAGARVGVIGLGAAAFHADGIVPARTWEELTARLPDATLAPVDADFLAMTRRLSTEEQELIRWCAHAGEEMCAAMLSATSAGVPETESYAAGIAASLRAGAHNSGSVLVIAPGGESLAWGPPSWTYRPRPPRIFQSGDLLLAELFPLYGMRETQQQLAIAIGPTDPDTDRAADAAEASYHAGVRAIRPGVTFGELATIMAEPVEDAGGWNLTPLAHTLNPLDAFTACGLRSEEVPGLKAYGPVGGVPTIGAELELAAGMTLALEPNCVIGRRRVNVGGTVIVTADGVEEVNQLPNRMQRV